MSFVCVWLWQSAVFSTLGSQLGDLGFKIWVEWRQIGSLLTPLPLSTQQCMGTRYQLRVKSHPPGCWSSTSRRQVTQEENRRCLDPGLIMLVTSGVHELQTCTGTHYWLLVVTWALLKLASKLFTSLFIPHMQMSFVNCLINASGSPEAKSFYHVSSQLGKYLFVSVYCKQLIYESLLSPKVFVLDIMNKFSCMSVTLVDTLGFSLFLVWWESGEHWCQSRSRHCVTNTTNPGMYATTLLSFWQVKITGAKLILLSLLFGNVI